jgi:N6-L-threonylcarbamoyladenine synthase/protein kinase Bud32
MRVLGIEGTAWAASAALYDDAENSIFIENDAYQPESGGIHPREAAEHMGEAIPQVVERVLDHAAETAAERTNVDSDDRGVDSNRYDIDAVAFSRGPGLGPCLRTVGTAARAAAQTLGVPLVGVNHMVAHLEIGRHQSGFESPVCINASGANAHLLGYHNGRYRILGETMDTGVGNSLDKFTRYIGWSHPGGPKVEQAATDGEFIDLPYVVKGMDFSFSGIMSAAKQAADDGEAVADICFSLQEHVFGMLTEVAERALSLTGTDELVLGGGVGQNARLQEMLRTMCAERGASFHVPEPRLLGDNAGMIAVLGAKQFAAGDTIAIEESTVDPNFRPDQVPVTWRADEQSVARGLGTATAVDGISGGNETTGAKQTTTQRGAEATVDIVDPEAIGRSLSARCVRKRRLPKTYRHPQLDSTLRRERTTAEARLTSQARRAGVPTPLVWDVDPEESTIWFEHVGTADLAAELSVDSVRDVGRHLATIHEAGFVHGDPTTRNVRIGDRTWLIDFGLGFHTGHVEDHAMDLHVFRQSLTATADDPEPLCEAVLAGYSEMGRPGVVDRLATIEGRGRYQ